MPSPLSLAAGFLALVGAGLLLAGLVALARAARSLDDAAPSRLLFLSAALVGIAAAMRVWRYGSGTYGSADAFLGVLLSATGWILAWRAAVRLPGVTPSIRSAGLVLALTGVASAVLQLGATTFQAAVQVGLGLELGFLGAVLATLGWRLRGAGRAGFAPRLALLSGLLVAGTAWVRVLVALGAQSGDTSLLVMTRLVPAGLVLLGALLTWPALEEFLGLLRPKVEDVAG